MEKLKLVSKAIQAGENESEVCAYLDQENIADFDLDNFKSRLEEKRNAKVAQDDHGAVELKEEEEELKEEMEVSEPIIE